ncbi:MAG: hypothetical protein NTY08_16325 [Proteobacteria bacterium]|nr:hypothetical protein [Pseudomonadota bacterium]
MIRGKKKGGAVATATQGSTHHDHVAIDTSWPEFREELFRITDRGEFDALLDTLDKVQKMTWDDVLKTSTKDPRDKRGLNWEPISSQQVNGKQVCTIRVTQRFRARVIRDGRFMRFISLHPDHDSAYR